MSKSVLASKKRPSAKKSAQAKPATRHMTIRGGLVVDTVSAEAQSSQSEIERMIEFILASRHGERAFVVVHLPPRDTEERD